MRAERKLMASRRAIASMSGVVRHHDLVEPSSCRGDAAQQPRSRFGPDRPMRARAVRGPDHLALPAQVFGRPGDHDRPCEAIGPASCVSRMSIVSGATVTRSMQVSIRSRSAAARTPTVGSSASASRTIVSTSWAATRDTDPGIPCGLEPAHRTRSSGSAAPFLIAWLGLMRLPRSSWIRPCNSASEAVLPSCRSRLASSRACTAANSSGDTIGLCSPG